jgi:hypothetical protein
MGRKVGIAVMVFFMLLGAAFFVYGVVTGDMNMSFYQVYVGAFAGVYGVFAGTDSFVKRSRSKYYRPELDDAHPEAQKAALQRAKREAER